MPVLMFINIKGGVAKTTNAVAVSQFLAERGKRVLVIDADHQCAAGEILLGGCEMNQRDVRNLTLHDLLSGMLKEDFDPDSFSDYVVPVEHAGSDEKKFNLSVLPCSLRMDDFQQNYFKAKARFHTTKDARAVREANLRALKSWLRTKFEYTIIDCPPSIPLQIQLLLRVADAYVVPCIPDMLSIRGADYLQDRLRRAKSKIPGLGTLWSLYRAQNGVHVEKVNAAANGELFKGMPLPFRAIIPNATAVARAIESDEESLNLRYTKEFATTYRELVAEILERCESTAV